jgi:hypothetical protein
VVLVLAGCSSATLPYRPDPQPAGGRVSAAYQLLGDRLRMEIDTGGRLLEQAWIMRPGGASVAAVAIEPAPVTVNPGPTFSIGVGGGSWGRGGGMGGGVSTDMPVGGGSRSVSGNTIVWFPAAAAGPEPWTLYVKVAGVEGTSFTVGGPPPR